ncbi:AAA family ATPase [Nitrosopumilus sp.]|uniref:AAA family ATPase n=1 Tax=Nitrosopumilus sp. TaxID=2024843 RepID=UPI00247DF891|nr:AAA family ATPase [Nitrosopumilus sp.]MCV0431213.1 ATP-binding protein [Nitrosopumilus sp.]
MEYVLMIGVALSGKTTYVKANFKHERIALSRFDNDRKDELEYIEKCLKKGISIVVDDTNLTESIRKSHIDLGKKYNAKIRGIFMNTSQGILEKRQKSRRDPFPLSAIYKQLRQLETPVVAEGFDELVVKKNYEQPRST